MKRKLRLWILILGLIGGGSIASAQINISLPDTFAVTGDTILVPLNVSDLSEVNVLSYQFKIQFDEAVIKILGCVSEGTLSSQWLPPLVNIEEDGEAIVGSFGFNSLLGSGVLVYLQCTAIGVPSDSSRLAFQEFIFNAGDPSVTTRDGLVRIYGAPVSIAFVTNIQETVAILIDGKEKTVPFDTTWFAGEKHSIGVVSPQYQSSDMRTVFDSWSDAGDTSHFIIPLTDTTFQCYMNTEYLLTILSEYGTVQEQQWYAQGTVATVSIDSLITQGDTLRYKFAEWKGSGADAYSGSDRIIEITMNGPVTETALWTTQYFLKLDSPLGNPSGQGWYDQGDTVHVSVDSLVSFVDGTRYRFQSWVGSGTGSYSGSLATAQVEVNGPITETAKWIKEHYLSVASSPEELLSFAENGWYVESDSLNDIFAPERIATPEIKYRFQHWLVDGENYFDNTISMVMDTSHVLVAVYAVDSVLVKINTNIPDVVYIIVDDKQFPTPYAEFWHYQSEHEVGIDTVQIVADSLRRYVFASWSDHEEQFHLVKADSSIELTALLATHYYLSVRTEPRGLIEFEETGWYGEKDTVALPEMPLRITTEADTFRFNTWQIDDVPIEGNPIRVYMDQPHDVVAKFENLYFISGRIVDSRGKAVGYVQLILSGARQDTSYSSPQGLYNFSSLTAGDYQITPLADWAEFEPMFREYAPLQGTHIEQDFIAKDILAPEIKLIYPNGGERLSRAAVDTIRWQAKDNRGIDSLLIQFSCDGGDSWRFIAALNSDSVEHYLWTFPDTSSMACLIKITAVDYDGNQAWDESDSVFYVGVPTEVVNVDEGALPQEFKVLPNYPNPFNNTTIIPLQLPKTAFVVLRIYNLTGQEIVTLVDEELKPGSHRFFWDARDKWGSMVSSGVYVYRVEALGVVMTRKLLYLR